jgi:hypothetical protein
MFALALLGLNKVQNSPLPKISMNPGILVANVDEIF